MYSVLYRMQQQNDRYLKTETASDYIVAVMVYTVEPLNKGHVGDNINSHVLSFVERLFSSQKL